MKKNQGYSLVELLIVMAIMAILTGVATVSIGLIKKARVRDAVQSFNSQLSNAWLQTKSTASGQKTMYMIIEGVNLGSNSQRNYEIKLYDDDGTTVTQKSFNGSSIDNQGHVSEQANAVTLNKYVTMSYKPSDSGQEESGYGDSSEKWYIKFDKATGAVIKGAGAYEFRNLSGELIATVHLDAVTGNHYIK